jgi:lysophospholipase L1-like esterase
MDVQAATNRASANALNSRFATDAFVPDRYLLWKMKPGSNVGGTAVDSRGVFDAKSGAAPEKGALRVLCLGDSIASATYRTYPDIAQRLTERLWPRKRIEFINASVAGYSTEQGLRWFRMLRETKPGVVVVCFGWNDHFPALNLPDQELGARNAFAALAHRLFRRTRLYQLLSAPSAERLQCQRENDHSLRVGPEEFDRNLRELVARIRAAGAEALLATQPANLASESIRHFEREQFTSSGATLASRHRDYNAITRSVAAELRTPLMDLEEEFGRRNRGYLFEPDGMHLAGPGQNLVARLLVGALRHQALLTQSEFDAVVHGARYDTTAPDKPRAAWAIDPVHADVSSIRPVSVGVVARNTGNTAWLRNHKVAQFGTRRNVSYGAVSIAAQWRGGSAQTTAPESLTRLAHDLYPGESTSQTLVLNPPGTPGDYAVEIGLRADGIGDLKYLGAEVTTLTVTARD